MLFGAVVVVVALGVALARPELLAQGLTSGLKAKERADVLGSGRDFGLKLAAGLGAVTAAILGWGRFELSKEELNADRFGRAVDQLGSDKGADVVLGGLYALEALAKSTVDYQNQITEVLSAFVREHARSREVEDPNAAGTFIRDLSVTEQAALTILGRNGTWRGRIDLTGANLKGARLSAANLNHADLAGADLTGAHLRLAGLTGADLTDAHLTDAHLTGADLIWANLTDADLTGANLKLADLTDANLTNANLTSANLTGAKLKLADLTDADLTDALLAAADLTGAHLKLADLTDADLPAPNT